MTPWSKPCVTNCLLLTIRLGCEEISEGRAKRKGEKDGAHYHYPVDDDEEGSFGTVGAFADAGDDIARDSRHGYSPTNLALAHALARAFALTGRGD